MTTAAVNVWPSEQIRWITSRLHLSWANGSWQVVARKACRAL